jgi:hypothetical protein
MANQYCVNYRFVGFEMIASSELDMAKVRVVGRGEDAKADVDLL